MVAAMNPFDLSGRVIVVTGGNGGIGLGIASALAGAGASIAIWARNRAKNAEALGRLRETGAAEAFVCDVADRASVDAARDATLARFGRIDGCIANAGVGGGGRTPFVDIGRDEWDKLLEVNLGGAFNSFQAIVPHMIERAGQGDAFGRLVALSSTAAIFGAARNEHYSASKAGMNGLMRALAVELARYHITANAIVAGYAESDMTADLMAQEKFMAQVMPRIPMRRFGTPVDFGGLAVYLMSDASSYHTGDAIRIDGGYSVY